MDLLYQGDHHGEKTGNVDDEQKRFLAVCREAGVTTVDRHAPVSAYADGEMLVRLIDHLNAAHVPYTVAEQEQRANDDGMPA